MVGLVIGVGLSVTVCYATDTEEYETDVIIIPSPSNETDVIIIPSPLLPPFFSDFSITPTEIVQGHDLIISFVIRNPNNQSITRMSATRIGDFFTQIIEIRLEAYESKFICYRIIPHAAGEYDVWIDGQTGTFKVISTEIIVVVDPLERLNRRIDGLIEELQTVYDDLQDADAHLKSDQIHEYDWIVALERRVDEQDVQIEELCQTLEYLENKVSGLQNTIAYVCIGTGIIVVLCAIILFKKGALGVKS